MDDTLIARIADAVVERLERREQKKPRIEPQRMTRDEAARYIGFRPRYLDGLTADGIIPRAKTKGKAVRYDKAVLDHYLLTTRKQA